jgi:hopanoid-associated phosphorylase
MIAIVVGMLSEADLVPAGLAVACSGGRPAKARALADRLLAEGTAGLVSFGIAGGLSPALHPGDLVIASGVATAGQVIAADADWCRRLAQALPDAYTGLVQGESDIAATPRRKADLFAATGALAVDLESAAVAGACQRAGRPFAVIRAIADPAGRSLPSLALDALDEDGRALPMKVAAGLLRRPWELPGLIGVAGDSRAAFSALRAAVGRLGPPFGFQPA